MKPLAGKSVVYILCPIFSIIPTSSVAYAAARSAVACLQSLRYHERSTVARVNVRLKDEFGGRMVRVRGHFREEFALIKIYV